MITATWQRLELRCTVFASQTSIHRMCIGLREAPEEFSFCSPFHSRQTTVRHHGIPTVYLCESPDYARRVHLHICDGRLEHRESKMDRVGSTHSCSYITCTSLAIMKFWYPIVLEHETNSIPFLAAIDANAMATIDCMCSEISGRRSAISRSQQPSSTARIILSSVCAASSSSRHANMHTRARR